MFGMNKGILKSTKNIGNNRLVKQRRYGLLSSKKDRLDFGNSGYETYLRKKIIAVLLLLIGPQTDVNAET